MGHGAGPSSPKRQRLLEDDIAAEEDDDELLGSEHNSRGASGATESTEEPFVARDYNGNQGLKDDLVNNASSDKDIKREKYEH